MSHAEEHSLAITGSALRSLSAASDGFDLLSADIRNGPLGQAIAAAVALIRARPGRLIVTGVGKSGHIARKLAATFASTGTPAYHLHPTEANHGDLGMIDRTDVIMALSWSGETSELAQTITYAKRFEVPLISLTSAGDSTLAMASSVALVLPRVREACPHNLAPTTSTLMQLAIGDAIAVALIEDRGFSPDDFKIFHPGGKLGAQLQTVGDLMHTGQSLPLTGLAADIAQAVRVMSAHGFGAVGVVDDAGNLAGMITDGDLRRHLSPDLAQRNVSAVMTHGPIVVGASTLAAEALKLMEARKIGALFVVDGMRPVGFIRTLDLLRAGVA